jgi:NADH:ubiquinone oxidoreductase subunit F (NADH-binding)
LTSQLIDEDRAMTTGAPVGLPRLLAPAVASYSEHLARYGLLPDLHKRAARAQLIDAVERAALRGRGGAGFPMARKMRAVADGGRAPVVVANGAEGEPASHKDLQLLTTAPHLVLDGAAAAARTVRASEIHVVVERANGAGYAALRDAIAERAAVGDDAPALRLVAVPSRYVAGEESALVHFLNGGDAKPTSVPPRPYERGVRGRPTLVQNVETLANLALVARFGAEWYRSVGTDDEPGSVLATVGGAVARPGVCEVAFGTPLGRVIEAVGGATAPIQAVLVGGYFGSWLPASVVDDLPLSHAALKRAGGALGCGIVHVLPVGHCGVVETARVARYLAGESAGQCGPCVYGLAAVADALETIARGRAANGTHQKLVQWLGDIEHRGACHLPDAAVAFVRSALTVFADEFAQHERHRRCSAADARPLLPIPEGPARDWSWR